MTNRIDKRYARLAAIAKRQRQKLADATIEKRALYAGCAADLLVLARDMVRRDRPDDLVKMVRKYAAKYARKAKIDS